MKKYHVQNVSEKDINNQPLLTVFRCQEVSTQGKPNVMNKLENTSQKTSVLLGILPLSNRTVYFLHQTLIVIILSHFPKWQCSNQD